MGQFQSMTVDVTVHASLTPYVSPAPAETVAAPPANEETAPEIQPGSNNAPAAEAKAQPAPDNAPASTPAMAEQEKQSQASQLAASVHPMQNTEPPEDEQPDVPKPRDVLKTLGL
jgi:hypothetical protein